MQEAADYLESQMNLANSQKKHTDQETVDPRRGEAYLGARRGRESRDRCRGRTTALDERRREKGPRQMLIESQE